MHLKPHYINRPLWLKRESDQSTAIALLSQREGVKSVKPGKKGNTLMLEYDQYHCDYQSLQNALIEQGIAMPASLVARLHSFWLGYIDQTARENAAAPPAACCNKPPRKSVK